MYSAKVTLKYDSTWDHKGGIYDDEILPEEHFTFEAPVDDINSIQLFQLFSKFAAAMGHNEEGIAKGACYLAFNEMRTTEQMRKTAEEYDLKLVEDHLDVLCKVEKLESEVRDLKAKLSRCENPDNPNYTEEEIDAMDAENSFKPWGNLVPGSVDAIAEGCLCPYLDNKEMPDDRKWVNGDCPIHGRKTAA